MKALTGTSRVIPRKSKPNKEFYEILKTNHLFQDKMFMDCGSIHQIEIDLQWNYISSPRKAYAEIN